MTGVEEHRDQDQDNDGDLSEEQLLVCGENKEGDHVAQEQAHSDQIDHDHRILVGQEAVLQPQGATRSGGEWML